MPSVGFTLFELIAVVVSLLEPHLRILALLRATTRTFLPMHFKWWNTVVLQILICKSDESKIQVQIGNFLQIHHKEKNSHNFVTIFHCGSINISEAHKNKNKKVSGIYIFNYLIMKKILSILLIMIFGAPNMSFAANTVWDGISVGEVTQWELTTIVGWESDPNAFSHEDDPQIAALPLKRTSVDARISGFVSRTYVTQEFQNPYKKPIEATYSFPLPHEASVDSMEMLVWDKKIIWRIDTRKEAERKYLEAKNNGQTAALLNQERPNIFTQKVANIMPGDNIKIKISYFEVLRYENWKYNYIFPMVVWPRYNPASVKDASNIESPTIKAGYREWHTIDLKLNILAWVNIRWLKSNSHDVNVRKINDSQAEITLKNASEIPNKDFSFIYDVASESPQIGFLIHKVASEKDWYFALIAEPQKSPKQSEIRDKEIVFVLDTSGSMTWRPIETVKKAMRKAISNLGPNDSFNVYNFNTQVFTLFPASKLADWSAKDEWLKYVENLEAWGGTMMDQPFMEALKNTWDSWDRMRIILWMMDWDIWNESEILSIIKTWLGQNRLFMLWVDAAANRYLIDKMAESWNWKATYVLGEDNIDEKVDEFYGNFASPVLTDIKVDWDWLSVTDVMPGRFADLYAGQPLHVYGKYSAGAFLDSLDKERNIRITAKRWNEAYSQTIKINFKKEEKENSSIAAFWARQKIDDIYRENSFMPNPKLEEEVTALGLKFSIMSEFTSFIAIDDTVRNGSGQIDTYKVPVYEVEWKDYSWIYWQSAQDSVQKSVNMPTINNSMPQREMSLWASNMMMEESLWGLWDKDSRLIWWNGTLKNAWHIALWILALFSWLWYLIVRSSRRKMPENPL
ncbi:MAG: hypothetical protein ACD_2C00267G0006 [uncultured bacterium (gcode 4)]|uniref:Uncharacterized protein n=1 Tax=uncultured bacterium (gcode 4) TaxID=1234023 RepID=K2GF13_9BACT|nr:MAG: hypothetical protein ACD_2C00267G0006 [uncultured bacterium (gcode 4)]